MESAIVERMFGSDSSLNNMFSRIGRALLAGLPIRKGSGPALHDLAEIRAPRALECA
jgi:hypothetical protein